MDPTRYERAKEVFLAACDLPETERRAFVERECGDDAELRAAVESLLDFDEGDDLAPPAGAPDGGRGASEERFSPGDVFADRYRVVSSLGRGGMGEVYHAIDLTLDVPVALKFPFVADAVHRARIVDEVRLARSVTHPAVARIYDIGTQDDEHYVSMEYVRGDDVGVLLERVGRMPPERVAQIGYRLVQGLAAAHEAGVLHRDIKPSNVLIGESGDPKLIDFGIATSIDASSAVHAGTPSYMSPEQLDGAPPSERSDLWSVGAVLYEMCTGRKPYDGANLEEIREARRTPAIPPSTLGVPIDAAFESAILEILSEDPAARPADAAALAERLDGIRKEREDRGTPGAAPSAPESERRQLTVLYCEIDDADGRLESLDPEDLDALSAIARREFERVAARYEGSLGDDRELEATIRFGYPVAHEDASTRALLAGVELRDRLDARLRPLVETHGAQARIRQGVHVGSAVVSAGSASAPRPRLTGNVFRVARQLARQAAHGELLVTEETRRTLRRRFDTRPAELSGSLTGHVVLGSRRRADAPSSAVSPDVPFVGRDEELALARERIRRAQSGRGQVLFVSGDGGVGKSRLLREIRRGLDSSAFEWRQASCSPLLKNTAFQPLVEAIRAELGVAGDPESSEAAHRFEDEAAKRQLDADERRRLAALLGLSPDGGGDSAQVAADARREQVLEAMSGWLLRASDQRTVVVVIEDLHWADPSTIDLLERLSESVAAEPAIVIATHRPEWNPTWPSRSHGTSLDLSPLTSEQAEDLVRSVGVRTLDGDAIERIVQRADGIPLFAEELAKHASEPTAAEIPETLRDTLVARLDRMGDAKPVAQCAAVLGRDFDLDALVSISDRSREDVTESLDDLVRADVLLRTRRGSSIVYAFRHALLRDAAYSSLIRERRVALHSLALDALRADGVTEEQAPEILALHAEFAGREPAILEYRQRAAEKAAERLANKEAVAHATRALEALSWQPSSRERDVKELELQTLLAVSLLAIEGFGSEVTAEAFERARALCVEVGSVDQQMPILYGIFSFHEVRADATALAVADEMARVAAKSGDPVLENVGCASRGHFRLWNGEVEACREVLAEVWQTEDLETQRSLAIRFGDDPIVCSPASLAAATCALGDLDEGMRILRESVARAEALGHPMTLAAVLSFTAIGAQLIDDVDLCDELVTRNEAVCREGRFPNWSTAVLAQRGWIEIRRGQPAVGIAKVESAIARCAVVGQRLFLQGMQLFVAEGELELGRVDAAIAATDKGLDALGETHERLWLPELHRVRGDALLAIGRRADAQAGYREAIDAARGQGAVVLELRAAVRLARLLAADGASDDARTLVEEPLSHVSHGAITNDVRAARELLAAS